MNLYIQKDDLRLSVESTLKEFPIFCAGDIVELSLIYINSGRRISFLESDEITVFLGRSFGNKILSFTSDFTVTKGIATMYLDLSTTEIADAMSNRDFLDLDIEIKLSRDGSSTTIIKSPCVLQKTLSFNSNSSVKAKLNDRR